GDNSRIELSIVSCTESSGRKGISEQRNIKVAGMAIRKLKDIAAARSARRIFFILAKKDLPRLYRVIPLAPGSRMLLVKANMRSAMLLIFCFGAANKVCNS